MKVTEEFTVKNASGKTVPLEFLTPKLTYLDYGFTHLPRGFQGYRVKNSATVVEKQADGTFKFPDNEIYTRVLPRN
jgi:hypothetical protein